MYCDCLSNERVLWRAVGREGGVGVVCGKGVEWEGRLQCSGGT